MNTGSSPSLKYTPQSFTAILVAMNDTKTPIEVYTYACDFSVFCYGQL